MVLFGTTNQIHNYNNHSNHLLFLPQVNTSHFGINPLKYNEPTTWNNLSQQISCLFEVKSQKSLKNLLKNHFWETYAT